MKPIVIVNFKSYLEAGGDNAVPFAKKLEPYAELYDLILAAQTADIYRLSDGQDLPVYAQHADDLAVGKGTGFALIENLKANGARGTLLNHAEHVLEKDLLFKTMLRCQENKFETVVCFSKKAELDSILEYSPTMVAYEVPEMIGTGQAIVNVYGAEIKKMVELIRDYNRKNNTEIKFLCGAGISSRSDLEKAVELGADGVILASALVKSKQPERELFF